MSSRKQEKERLRQERMEAEHRASSEARKRLMLGYIVAGALGLAVVGGAIFAIASGGGDDGGDGGGEDGSVNVNTQFGFLPESLPVDEREGTPPPPVENGDLEGAANVAGCDLQLNLADEGNDHFEDEDKVVKYKTNPPTSGDHFSDPNEVGSGALADGAFLETPNPNRLLHSLEHGRVLIQYSPDLPEEDQLALKGVFDEARPGVTLFPNADMPYDVAATAWTQMVGCDTFEGAADARRDPRLPRPVPRPGPRAGRLLGRSPVCTPAPGGAGPRPAWEHRVATSRGVPCWNAREGSLTR